MVTANVKTNPLIELQQVGQSPWVDSFKRGWLTSGELQRMIREDGARGVTVNPTIFEKAISGSTDYDDAIRELVAQGKDSQQVYEALMVQDIGMAADLFREVYDSADRSDGFVSIELPPSLSYDTAGTIKEAHRFRSMIDRENIMVKVPGTAEGVPAVEELTYDGINVNITLLFSIEDYENVAYAYIRGLERRLRDGKPLNSLASVASFFVSRIDSAVDQQLEKMISTETDPDRRSELDSLTGKSAIANAKIAYQRFKAIFSEQRFKDLEQKGARVQKVLWASTSTKSPKYPDLYYVENLIGPQTVDTMPPDTIAAFKDHGRVRLTIEENLDEANSVLRRLGDVGIDFADVTHKLQVEGVDKFQASVDQMMAVLAAKRDASGG